MDYQAAYERLQREIQEDRDSAYEQREQARHERQREREEAMLYADDWADAFSKAIPRLQREADEEAELNARIEESPDEYQTHADWFFKDTIEQYRYAREMWSDENKSAAGRIRRIRERAERMIAAIEQEARVNAAESTDAHFNKQTNIGDFLRDDNYSALVEW